MAREALARAQGGLSDGPYAQANIATIIREFASRGIPAGDIKPRENVFTFQAWRALNRTVKRGERGVRVTTFIPVERTERDPSTGEEKTVNSARPWSATVFHISQTTEWFGTN